MRPNDPPMIMKNVEAEASIIGALMIENKMIDGVADRLRPEHFDAQLGYQPI